MPSSGSWNNTTYSIPLAGELNWSVLSNFLIDLRNNAQTTNSQKIGARVATSTPVTVSAITDAVIGINIGSASAVNLPAGATGQVFTIVDTSGAAATNNITIDGNAAETINGSATYVINRNNAGVTLSWTGTEWNIISESISGGATTGTGSAVLSVSPTFTGTVGAGNITLTGDLTISAATAGNVYSGTYTPSFVNAANVASIDSTYDLHYMVVGKVLHVAGRVDVTPTLSAPTSTAMTCTLPNSINIETSPGDVGGTGMITGDCVRVAENAATLVQFQWFASSGGAQVMWFMFSTKIV